jgi:hypothetical protein
LVKNENFVKAASRRQLRMNISIQKVKTNHPEVLAFDELPNPE